MKVYVILKELVGGSPYAEVAFKEEGDAWDYLKANPDSEIVGRTIHEVRLEH